MGAAHPRVLEGGRRPPKRFFKLGGRFMAAPTQKPRKKIKNRKKRKLMNDAGREVLEIDNAFYKYLN